MTNSLNETLTSQTDVAREESGGKLSVAEFTAIFPSLEWPCPWTNEIIFDKVGIYNAGNTGGTLSTQKAKWTVALYNGSAEVLCEQFGGTKDGGKRLAERFSKAMRAKLDPPQA